MSYLLFGTLIVLIVLGIGAARRISLYSPLMISALVWQFVFACGLLVGNHFYPVTDRAFVLWLVWFLVSSTAYFFLSDQPPEAGAAECRRLPLDYSLALVALILWLAYQIRAVGSAGPAQFLSNLRLSANDNAGLTSLRFVDRFYPWVFALFIFEHVNARAGNRRLRFLLWFLMMQFTMATMGKLTALTPILAWAVIKGVRGGLPLRKLAVLVPAIFCLLIGLHLARALVGEKTEIGTFLGLYVYSPLVALGYMATPHDLPFGAHTFRFVYALWHALAGGAQPVEVVQGYVAVPLPTNVYTVIQPFALDFGVVGVALGAAIYGVFFSLLFRLARLNGQLSLILYAGFSMALVGQFIGEFMFTMFSGQLQFVIAAVLVVSQSRRVPAQAKAV